LESAEQLNPWDARVAMGKARFLEKLYLATGDGLWKAKSDEAMGRVLGLEPQKGEWYWEKAGMLSGRALKERTPGAADQAVLSWREAENRLPFCAYLRYEEGMFFLETGKKEEAAASLWRAVELEPGYAVAWAKLGLLLKMGGKGRESKDAFARALRIDEAWKDKPLDAPEKPMLDLPPAVLDQMRRELGA
jgi:tetratricopeptide (TPR) repeat protein